MFEDKWQAVMNLLEELMNEHPELAEDDEYLVARRCPNCDAESYVVDTREASDGTIHRRRECPNCGQRFATREIFDHNIEGKCDRLRFGR